MKKLKSSHALGAFALSLSLVAVPATAGGPAIPNFHQVNDHIYRGAQPEPQAWAELAKMGVKTVIDLRLEDEHPTAVEGQAVASAGMRYINIPMKGFATPTNEQISKVLALLNSDEPVFVHCRKGADRTGAVIACYRIAHDHWQADRALQEAKAFGMSSLQLSLKRYVKAFQPTTMAALQPSN